MTLTLKGKDIGWHDTLKESQDNKFLVIKLNNIYLLKSFEYYTIDIILFISNWCFSVCIWTWLSIIESNIHDATQPMNTYGPLPILIQLCFGY